MFKLEKEMDRRWHFNSYHVFHVHFRQCFAVTKWVWPGTASISERRPIQGTWAEHRTQIKVMSRSRNFRQWGWGGSKSIWQKKLWQRFFVCFMGPQIVNFKENYHFSRFQRGSNIFQGGRGNIYRGGGGGPTTYFL